MFIIMFVQNTHRHQHIKNNSSIDEVILFYIVTSCIRTYFLVLIKTYFYFVYKIIGLFIKHHHCLFVTSTYYG